MIKYRGTESLFSLLIYKDISDCSFGLIVFLLVVFSGCRVMKSNLSVIRKSKVNISAWWKTSITLAEQCGMGSHKPNPNMDREAEKVKESADLKHVSVSACISTVV